MYTNTTRQAKKKAIRELSDNLGKPVSGKAFRRMEKQIRRGLKASHK